MGGEKNVYPRGNVNENVPGVSEYVPSGLQYWHFEAGTNVWR